MRVPDALVGAGQLREKTPTENIGPSGLLGAGRRVNNPTPGKKKHYHEIRGSKNRTDLPRTTLQRTKGLESWLMECVIFILIRCPEDAVITARLI